MSITAPSDERISLTQNLPFFATHLGCLLVFWTGVSRIALVVCVVSYLVRAFGMSGGYHRYFSHRSFKTSRLFQFFLAWLGASGGQMGPLWWAAIHRHHHRHADTEEDIHSPRKGLWWAYAGWLLSGKYAATDESAVKEFTRFPELRWLNRYHYVAPVTTAVLMYGLGSWLHVHAPHLHTTGLQMVAWGFFVSTVLTFQPTFLINSLTHRSGRRAFNTPDDSRNLWWLAFLTLGEGWHNNHHAYPSSACFGSAWWEIDISYCVIKGLSWIGVVWDVQEPPADALKI